MIVLCAPISDALGAHRFPGPIGARACGRRRTHSGADAATRFREQPGRRRDQDMASLQREPQSAWSMRSMVMSLVGAGTPALGIGVSVLMETMMLREPSGLTPLRVMKPWMSPPWDQEPPQELGIHMRPRP